MSILDLVLQLVAAALLLYGLYHMGDYKLRGPALAGLSEILWVGVGVWHGLWGLIFLSAVLTVMQARNFIAWYQRDHAW